MSMFTAGEAYQFAIRIEEDGEHYYHEIAKKLKDKEAKALFNFLAEEEIKHKKTFEKLLEGMEKYEPAESYPEEYFEYLKAYADNVIFAKDKLKDEASKVSDTVSGAEFGMRREIESIEYYSHIRGIVPPKDRPSIDKIIDEERKHFVKLVGIKEELKKG